MGYIIRDITRGSPNYTFGTYYYISGAAASVNITDSVFMTALEGGGLAANLSDPGARSVAYSGAGVFDTLSIVGWRGFPQLEIDSIGVCRYS